MGFSNLIAFFIILSTAVTLHAAGITHIETSAQAAEALRPIAGELPSSLFAWASSAPACWRCRCWRARPPMPWRRPSTGSRASIESCSKRTEFYAIVTFATLGGVLLDFTPVDPIKALFWSAVINGVIAVPIMAVMMLIAARPEVMGPFVITRRLKVLGWLATLVMLLAVVAMFMTW